MKVSPINYNYERTSGTVRYASPNFQAKYRVPNDVFNKKRTPVDEQVKKLLGFLYSLEAKSKKTFRDGFVDAKQEVGNFFNGNNKIIKHLKDEYANSGKVWFVQTFKDLFDNLINNPQNEPLFRYNEFKNDVETILNGTGLDRGAVKIKIGKRNEEELYNYGLKTGAIEFLKMHELFLLTARSSEQVAETKNEQGPDAELKEILPNVTKKEEVAEKPAKENFDGVLSQYREIVAKQSDFPEEGTDAEKAAWREMDEQRRSLLKQLCDNNVSILDKKEFSTNPTQDLEAKMDYLTDIRSESRANKATQLDVLEEYSKYGYRYWSNQETGDCFIRDLYLASFPISNLGVKDNKEHYYTVVEKFLDIAENLAERDNSGMRDAVKIIGIMDYYNEILDEKLALRFIKLLKKTSFQQIDYDLAKYYLNHLEESENVNNALDELKVHLAGFPYEDKTLKD